MTSLQEFGDTLRKAREAKGLSREDLFGLTRINLRHIAAIEAGDFPSVPQTYIRAFIREFARVTGLDEDATLGIYNDLAEEIAGIPKPPEAIDNSNILPQPDDSIEIIHASSAVPRHVEVQGRPEVEDQDFVQQVRRSVSVTDDLTETIDIRVSNAPPRPPAHDAPEVDEAQLPIEFSDLPAGKAVEVMPVELDTTAADTPPPPPASPTPATAPMAAPSAVPSATPPPPPAAASAGPKGVPEAVPAAFTTPRPKPAPRPVAAPDDDSSPRRMMIIAGVIVVIIGLGIAGAFLFKGTGRVETGLLDSAGLQSSIDAGRYADSLQGGQNPLAFGDTVNSDEPPEELAMEPRAKIYSSDDSLVLEAFSSAPVWFYVRMDTTRSERGTMSSNDHYMWKARDQFTVTLGDAGSVSFYLNGHPIGTLGNDNAVVKNVPITRRMLKNE